MPYSNFDDIRSFRSIYRESQQEDTDMGIGEFIFEKLLTVGELFEGDEEEEHEMPKQHQPVPLQIQPIQAGSLYCSKIIITEQDKKPVPAKPTCLFRENKFSFDFHASVFHPPSVLS
jgi:hypothetical protein